MQIYLCFFITLLSIQLINSECPNGCSGHGSCGYKDMCTCYKNYQGSDCSERICPFGYAHADTLKGDLNMNGDLSSTNVQSQVYLSGMNEALSTDIDEAHFYMECSNKGLCDRETGDCACFEGYEGSSCQRASCPNQCSGHGTCESIGEFATYGDGSLITKSYNLWDKKATYGCKCDPLFFGADCSLRNCKVGADPLYDSDLLKVDQFQLIPNGLDATNEFITLKFWDYFGESFETKRIIFSATAATFISNIKNAFSSLPNDMFSSPPDCQANKDDTSKIICSLTSHYGSLRLVEVGQISLASGDDTNPAITTTPIRGEDFTLTPTKYITSTTQSVSDTGTITTENLADATYLAAINDIYVALTVASDTGTVKATLDDSMIQYDVVGEAISHIGETLTSVGAFSGNVGDKTLTCSSFTSPSVGSLIIYEGQIYRVTAVVDNTSISIDRPFYGGLNSVANVADKDLYVIPASISHTYVSECSSRGLCDYESGICNCFTGYTNDNCDTQNVLAF